MKSWYSVNKIALIQLLRCLPIHTYHYQRSNVLLCNYYSEQPVSFANEIWRTATAVLQGSESAVRRRCCWGFKPASRDCPFRWIHQNILKQNVAFIYLENLSKNKTPLLSNSLTADESKPCLLARPVRARTDTRTQERASSRT